MGQFDYHPKLGIQLGRGFHLTNTEAALDAFLDVDTTILTYDKGTDPSAPVASNLTVSFIQGRKEINQALSTDAYVRASYLSVSLAADFQLDEAALTSESSITFAMHASSRYPIAYLGQLSYLPGKRELLESDRDAFMSEYGTHYVHGVQRGLDLTVFVTVGFSSREIRNSVASSAKIEGGGLAWSGEGAVTFNKRLKETAEDGTLNISIASQGGPHAFGDLSDIIQGAAAHTDAFAAIKKAVTKYMKEFNRSNAYVSRYYFKPMPNQNGAEPKGPSVKGTLVPLIDEYDALYDLQGKQFRLLQSAMFRDVATPEERKEIIRMIEEAQDAQDSLRSQILRCRDLSMQAISLCKCCNLPIFDIRSTTYDQYAFELERMSFYVSKHGETVEPEGLIFSRHGNLPHLVGRTLKVKAVVYVAANGTQEPCAIDLIFNTTGNSAVTIRDNASGGWHRVQIEKDVVVPPDGEVDISLVFTNAFGTGPGMGRLKGAFDKGSYMTVEYSH